ncbi:hypothetical protein FT663_05230 [Candidozyma haemuli var. vulneris]|uniref:Major facilitator superfamily (MFS) profile domain-containing protein n=1 Tax=Candidozyma haemuli TaxID=45357 RepID=A0A2V1ATE6_9ASCO|nr:hypothetical protein CXQ85_004550 [[Candida] haemuloni]KAF3985616.1 hypothetical protein FT663_05230 [[Candida] haemuloni var. vulneris]KAF3990882.1 hypothetical protein FT662_02044 [[Candida] haemuloni var. vulneris]PVH21032.1 hypothetical protein CXQ85_004550 [[Candida] haemuloni]
MGQDDKKSGASVSIADVDVENGITSYISPTTGKALHLAETKDEALDYIMSQDEERPILDEETDRKLLFKIDCCVLPVVCLLYAVQFMDKSSNAMAAVMGLREDLNMEGNMYSWTGSAFYLGYLAFELPCSYTLQKFPVITTVSIFIVLWGIVLCLHAVPNYEGFIALRTLLGALESSVTPAFVIVTSQWYKKEEAFFRTALWFSFNGVGVMLGSSAVALSLYNNMDGYAIEAWRLIFIITGAITIFMGFVVFFHLPNKPTEAWFLTDHEKRLVVERIRSNQQGFGNKTFKKYQLIEAITDIKTWLYFFIGVATTIPNGGLTNFSSILLHESFGYGVPETLKIQTVCGAIELVGCSLFGYAYKFYPKRLFWANAANIVVLVGLCLVAFAPDKHAQLGGYCLFYVCPVVMICGLSSSASNVAGHTKKVTVNALFLIGYCTGNLVGPQTFRAEQAPDYVGAKVAMVICTAFTSVFMAMVWIVMARENRIRDAKGDNHEQFDKIEDLEFADLTDKENPLFRYTI